MLASFILVATPLVKRFLNTLIFDHILFIGPSDLDISYTGLESDGIHVTALRNQEAKNW